MATKGKTGKGHAPKRTAAAVVGKRTASAVVGKRPARKRPAGQRSVKRGADPSEPERRRKRKQRQRFLPFAFHRHGLEASVTALELDGAATPDPLDADRRTITLEDDDWEQVRLSVALDVPAELLAAVMPPTEVAGAPATAPVDLLLVLHCTDTRLRRPIWVSRGPLSAGRHAAELTLDRTEVCRSAELCAYLVRAAAAEVPTAGYAWVAGARLADARPWTFRFEQRPAPPGRFLDVRYRSFREDEVLAPHHGNVYHLELDDELPVLWVNTDHGQLTPILSDKGSTGKRARLREVFYDLIAQGVWTQLFLRALDDLRTDGELTYDWEDAVLRELLPTMLPGHRSHRERLAALARAAERDGLPTLVARLDAALQRRSEISRHMSRLVTETVEVPTR